MITYQGIDIWKCPVDPGGFSIYSDEYEQIETAHYDNMSYHKFSQMPAWYKEMMIAHKRTADQKSAVWAYAHKPKS